MMKLQAAKAAENDIQKILAFYAAPSTASNQFAANLESALLHLCTWPRSGHTRTDLTPADVLFWLAKPYFVIYALEGNTLSILAVLHTARNIPFILRRRLR